MDSFNMSKIFYDTFMVVIFNIIKKFNNMLIFKLKLVLVNSYLLFKSYIIIIFF